jgi:hypothetical protein
MLQRRASGAKAELLGESFRNSCGMKLLAGGGDCDKDAHMRFDSWINGISAQADHLTL